MLHMDGTDASTTFTDSSYAGANSPHTFTAAAAAQIDTAQSKFGGASTLFTGAASYLTSADSADWLFGSGNFAIDSWVRWASLPGSGDLNMLALQRVDANNRWRFYLYNNAGTYEWRFRHYPNNATPDISMIVNTATLAANTWYHIEIDRSGNSWYIFQDGTQCGSTYTDTNDIHDFAATLDLGYETAVASFSGWMDEFRITKGIARHTANFTPPTRAYSYFGGKFLGVSNAEGTESIGKIMGVDQTNIRRVIGV